VGRGFDGSETEASSRIARWCDGRCLEQVMALLPVKGVRGSRLRRALLPLKRVAGERGIVPLRGTLAS